MTLKTKISTLEKTILQFGSAGEFVDPKIGLTTAGPFDLRFGNARKTQIRVGIIGQSQEIRNAINWLTRCKESILSGNRQDIHPDYPGFANAFHADLITNKVWHIDLDHIESIDKALKIEDERQRFEKVLSIYERGLNTVAGLNIPPDVILCALSQDVFKNCFSISKQLTKEEKKTIKSYKDISESWQLKLFDDEDEDEDEFLLNRDFRRALKAKAMKLRIPIQLGTNKLFKDSIKGQDPATRAWNFTVALYYKGGGIPWRLKSEGPETCFVGISFHHLQTNFQHLVFSSIAQAFSSKGDGFAIKGESVPWDREQGRNVHLTEGQAYLLGNQILNQYQEHTGSLPLRIVLHKTSRFSEEEEKGFNRAFQEIPMVELINIMPTPVRLIQIGDYPPKRGTLLNINDRHFLFTTGYIESLNTYPGPHIPSPVEIISSKNIDIYRAAYEILGLTRMNWNTASITGGQPVTFSFSRNVGGIMAEYGDADTLPSSFKFYM